MAKANPKTTEVWYVWGTNPTEPFPMLFSDKLSAEKYARMMFPNEDEDKRYARVYYREVFSLEE